MQDFNGHWHVFLRSNYNIFVAKFERYRRSMLHVHKNQSKKYVFSLPVAINRAKGFTSKSILIPVFSYHSMLMLFVPPTSRTLRISNDGRESHGRLWRMRPIWKPMRSLTLQSRGQWEQCCRGVVPGSVVSLHLCSEHGRKMPNCKASYLTRRMFVKNE